MSYYKTGGTYERLYKPSSLISLTKALKEIKKSEYPFFVLGAGSNSLVSDEHWPGTVILMKHLTDISFRKSSKDAADEVRVVVEAGVDNSLLAETCLKKGLQGAEWLYRLPGQIGGSVYMNARCYGGEMSKIVLEVTSVDLEGNVITRPADQIFKGYKSTLFMKNSELIASATFKFSKGEKESIQQKMTSCEKDRNLNGHFLFPSCGCVFKNDYNIGVPSGFILEISGVKGTTLGGAEVSPQHANFIYNKGATSRDILELSLKIRETAFSKFGIWLSYEMEILGELPSDLKEKVNEKRQHTIDDATLNDLREKWRLKKINFN